MRKQNDREELKQKIVLETQKAFLKHGIRNVHMDDIALHLSISKRTIYELFGDKEELIKAVFTYYKKVSNEYIIGIAEKTDNVLEVIVAFHERKLNEMANINPLFFRDLRKHPNVLTFIREENRKSNIYAMEYVQKGVNQGILRSDINYPILFQLMEMQMDLLVYSDISEKYPLEEIFREFSNLNLRGIVTEKGFALVDEFFRRRNKSDNQ